MNFNYSDNESVDSFAGKDRKSKPKYNPKEIAKYKTALEEKDNKINKMKDVMIEDEKVKIQMKAKLDELKKQLNDIQSGFKESNLTDEELDLLLGRENAALDLFNNQITENTNPLSAIDDHPYTDSLNLKNLEFLGGGNAMYNDYQSKIIGLRKQTCWGRLKLRIENIVMFLTPFKSEMTKLRRRFDRNTIGYFEIIRFLFCLHCFVFFTQLFMLFNHFSYIDSSSNTNLDVNSIEDINNLQSSFTSCRYNIPCFMFYSRFTENEKMVYSGTYLATCIITFIVITNKWVWSKRIDVLNDLFLNDRYYFSKCVFNMWDWNVKNENEEDDMRETIKNILTLGFYETRIKNIVKRRPLKVKSKLLWKRSISILFSIIVLIIGGGLIISLYLLQGYIIANQTGSNTINSSSKFLDMIKSVLPALGLSIVNFIVPLILEKLVKYEKWDYNSTYISQLFWRSYIAKMFSLSVIYFLVFYIGIFNPPSIDSNSNSKFDFKMNHSCPSTNYIYKNNQVSFPSTLVDFNNYANCDEDHLGSELFIVIMVDWCVRKISPFLMYGFKYMFYKKRKNIDKFKSKYDLSNKSTSQVAFAIQMHMIFLFFPYMSMIAPLLLFLDFKFESFSIRKLHEKPEKMTLQEKTGLVILSLFNITMLGVICFFIYFFGVEFDRKTYLNCLNNKNEYNIYYSNRSCGPFTGKESQSKVIIDSIINNAFIGSIYKLMISPIFLSIIIIFLISTLLYKYHDSNALKFYIYEKRKENTFNELKSNDTISRLSAEVKFLRGNFKNKNK